MNKVSQMQHEAVLLKEVESLIPNKQNIIVFDGTLGAAGHAKAICNKLDETSRYIATDVDSEAIEHAKQQLQDVCCEVTLKHDSFANIDLIIKELDLKAIDVAFFDLGWRLDQIKDAQRGFSFMNDGPLDMRLGEKVATSLTAADLVNTLGEEELAAIIYHYGDERFSRKIAKKVIETRKENPITTTKQLADLVASVVFTKGKTHPATKTFQALRIAVNDEYGAIEKGIPDAFELLNQEGLLMVITFHSGEDRIIKRMFQKWNKEGKGEILFKKGITASEEELGKNPRARSARMRVIQKK